MAVLLWALLAEKVNPATPQTVENSKDRVYNSHILGLLLMKRAEKVNPATPQTVENS